MRFYILTILVYLSILSTSQSQSLKLVDDYFPGVEGPVSNIVYKYYEELIYLGMNDQVQMGVQSYDPVSSQFSTKLLQEELDFEFDFMSSNGEEIIITTRDDFRVPSIYRSQTPDFSDFFKLYTTEEGSVAISRILEDRIVFREEVQRAETVVNVKIVDDFGNIVTVVEEEIGGRFDFNVTTIDGHVIVSHDDRDIDGAPLVIYDYENDKFVDPENFISGYTPCGQISSVFGLNDRFLIYSCDETYIYDYVNQDFIPIEGGRPFIMYHTDDDLFYTLQGDFIKMNINTGEMTTLAKGLGASRISRNIFVYYTDVGGFVEMHYYKFETNENASYVTSIPTDSIGNRFTSFGIVDAGIHLVIYESGNDKGILCRINDEEFIVIDSICDVTFRNRPVAFDNDIYISHNNPTYGNELFILDYTVSSENPSFTNAVKIFPNPTSSEVFFDNQSPLELLTVYNVLGQPVLQEQQTKSIDLGDLQVGTYFLKARTNSGDILTSTVVKN